MQLALDTATWDIHLDSTGNIACLSELPPLLSQRVQTRLQTFQGECFLDRDIGVPYFSEVLKKRPDIRRVRSLLASVIAGVEGVARVLSLELDFRQGTRELHVAFRVLGESGDIAEGGV